AIVDTCKYFQHILLRNYFTIITDNSSLKTLLSKPTNLLNNHQIHWIEILSPFNFEILHIPSSKNIIADTLSHLHEKDPSPPTSSSNTPSSLPIISDMNAEQYPYLPDWDDMSDEKDETYQDHDFTDDEVVTAFVDAVLAGELDEFTEPDNEAYEADEELDLEIQPRISLDMEDEHWFSNDLSSFLTEAIEASVEEDPSTRSLSSFSLEEFDTLPPEQLALMKSQGDLTP